jgi:hypothetical protein
VVLCCCAGSSALGSGAAAVELPISSAVETDRATLARLTLRSFLGRLIGSVAVMSKLT